MSFIDMKSGDLLNMKKADFDKAMKEDKTSVEDLLSIVNYLKYQYLLATRHIEELKKTALALPDGDNKNQCLETIRNLYGYANRFEYMIVQMNEKVDRLSQGVI